MNLALDYAADRPRRRATVPAGIRLRRLRRVRGLDVYLVDGERIRNEIYTDFTMGGTEARYAFIPRGEVWIESTLSPFDRKATLLHEIVERRRMFDGLSYGDAHDEATEVERMFRRSRRASG